MSWIRTERVHALPDAAIQLPVSFLYYFFGKKDLAIEADNPSSLLRILTFRLLIKKLGRCMYSS